MGQFTKHLLNLKKNHFGVIVTNFRVPSSLKNKDYTSLSNNLTKMYYFTKIIHKNI